MNNQGYNPNQNTPNNNASPNDIQNIQKALRTNSQYLCCPFCKNNGNTKVEQKCSCCNLLCCICTGALPWLIMQACRGKDINCYDADHFCTKCGNKLASYTAC